MSRVWRQRLAANIFLYHCLSHIEAEARIAILARHLALGIPCPALLHAPCTQALQMWTPALVLVEQALYPVTHLPSPVLRLPGPTAQLPWSRFLLVSFLSQAFCYWSGVSLPFMYRLEQSNRSTLGQNIYYPKQTVFNFPHYEMSSYLYLSLHFFHVSCFLPWNTDHQAMCAGACLQLWSKSQGQPGYIVSKQNSNNKMTF